jgi:integrase
MRTWSADDLRDFLDGLHGDRLYAAWHVAASTGLRRGELLALRWDDIDLEGARLSVRRSFVSVGYEVRLSEPKTKRSRRQLALDRATVGALRDHRRRQLEERISWGPAWQDTGLVFTREDGTLIHPDRLTKSFNRHVNGSGLPRIRLHDLRHTHATLALQAGIHPKVVSERLGHATVSITLDTYSHAIPAMQQDAAERVAELVFGSRSRIL